MSWLDLNKTEDYVLKNDKGTPPIVWKIGVISSYLFARISGESEKKEIDTAYRLLQLSLKGWENSSVPYGTVKEKIFDREIEVVPISTLERLPLTVISELSIKSMQVNNLMDDERKN